MVLSEQTIMSLLESLTDPEPTTAQSEMPSPASFPAAEQEPFNGIDAVPGIINLVRTCTYCGYQTPKIRCHVCGSIDGDPPVRPY